MIGEQRYIKAQMNAWKSGGKNVHLVQVYRIAKDTDFKPELSKQETATTRLDMINKALEQARLWGDGTTLSIETTHTMRHYINMRGRMYDRDDKKVTLRSIRNIR